MSKSVSNDALWEKLSEISGQLNTLSTGLKPQVASKEQAENAPCFNGVKEEIIAQIKDQAQKLGAHGDSNYKIINRNIGALSEKTHKVLNIAGRIWKQQREEVQTQKEDKKDYFNFRFFKVRKTSLVITILGLLVLILILFCMKQQNDYTLLVNEYYRQNIVIKEVQTEVDSLKATVQKPEPVKKRW